MERQQILRVMVPVAAFAVVLLVVGVVIALAGGGAASTTGGGGASGQLGSQVSKFDFPLDGPEWKDVPNAPGLKMWEVTEGTGEVCPTLDERPNLVPVMHYTGWLTDGTQFDSSRTKGKPLELGLARLVAGWQRGVPGMKVGGVRRLLIPSALGYGPQGQGSIPGGATLVFEMELLGVR